MIIRAELEKMLHGPHAHRQLKKLENLSAARRLDADLIQYCANGGVLTAEEDVLWMQLSNRILTYETDKYKTKKLYKTVTMHEPILVDHDDKYMPCVHQLHLKRR